MSARLLISRLLCAAAALGATQVIAAPLAQGSAGIVGSWSSRWHAVDGLIFRRVEEKGGCLRWVEGSGWLEDHQDVSRLPVWNVKVLKPGKYALVAVAWHDHYFDNAFFKGESEQDGELWVADFAPNVVTDVGNWAVSSPYGHRYVAAPAESELERQSAEAAANRLPAPLVKTQWTKMRVARPDGACPMG